MAMTYHVPGRKYKTAGCLLRPKKNAPDCYYGVLPHNKACEKWEERRDCTTCERYRPMGFVGGNHTYHYCLVERYYIPCDPRESRNCELYVKSKIGLED